MVAALLQHPLLQHPLLQHPLVAELRARGNQWLQPAAQKLGLALHPWHQAAHQALQPYAHDPVAVAAGAACAALLALLALQLLLAWWQRMAEEGGIRPAFFNTMRVLPFLAGYVRKEKQKMRDELLAGRVHKVEPITALPARGMASSAVLKLVAEKAQQDVQVTPGRSQLSGAVYIGSAEHREMLSAVYARFALSNPLHAGVWPSVRQMEAEVVAMAGRLLGGGGAANPHVCGAMTSGGSESILMAMKAARDWARTKRGIRKPEIIIAQSAHAAYFKAASYFRMRLVMLPVGTDLRLSGKAVAKALTRNTAVVIASAPGFPHGVVDHVESIAKVCRSARVWLHVDACLGGFVLPFARKLGRHVPAFDFAVPGVTSMSIDTHKFGLADKGTSCVLYASPEHRMMQFTSITDWSGGLYISPTMAGSRPGALIATAWASMVRMGEDGYLESTRKLMAVVDRFVAGIRAMPDLEVMGSPEMSVVAFKATNPASLNIYKLSDLLGKQGWHFNALQSPPALHFCFTPAHAGGGEDVAQRLLDSLAAGVATLKANPDAVKGGSAPMYGMANVVPDRGMIGEFLVAYQDVMLEP